MAVYAVIDNHYYAGDYGDMVMIDAEMKDDVGDYYIGYVENCFDPFKVAVRAPSFEEAYEWLITHPRIEADISVTTDEELADYGDDPFGSGALTMNDNGVWCDTESVMLRKAEKMIIRFDKPLVRF